MPVNYVNSSVNVWPSYSKDNVNKAGTTEEQQTLGKDQFLSLLITQLKYQNPLQPMEDREFIAQLAQFTQLEQMMNISSQLTDMRQSLGAVSSFIGKKVSWVEYVEGNTGETTLKSGVVDSVLIRDGIQYARIGSEEVALDYIIQIENHVPESEVPDAGNLDNPETPAAEPEGPSADSSTDTETPVESSESSPQSSEDHGGTTP